MLVLQSVMGLSDFKVVKFLGKGSYGSVHKVIRLTDGKEYAKELLSRVGLSERLHHRPSELSGGERQRVAIARALACKPSLVLMDEPTGNLDPSTAESVLGLLKELNTELNISFVIVTHDPHLAQQLDRTISLIDGVLGSSLD